MRNYQSISKKKTLNYNKIKKKQQATLVGQCMLSCYICTIERT